MGRGVLILGGAGFIGSNIAEYYLKNNVPVTVVDGLLKGTGGRIENIGPFASKIQFINARIEDVAHLNSIIEKSSIVIDCMAWTSHRLALSDPFYDLELNAKSHLYVLDKIKKSVNCKFIYLTSRGQYGNPDTDIIDEETRMIPVDVQGIHKLTGEYYCRIFSKLKHLNIMSIRFPNCFGENQPIIGDDIGLIGSFIKDILTEKTVTIYGHGRKRNIIYVKDLAEIIYRLSKTNFVGFSAYNLRGHEIAIKDLVKLIIKIAGKGNYENKKFKNEINQIETGNAIFSDKKLKNFLGGYSLTQIEKSIAATIKYFKEILE